MRNPVRKPCALLFVAAAVCLTSACSRREPVQAGSAKPEDTPTVAVAKVARRTFRMTWC